MTAALAGVCGFAAGCAGDAAPQEREAKINHDDEIKSIRTPYDFSALEFTTDGKRRQIIQTPSGPIKIYDPKQDPAVRVAYEIVAFREPIDGPPKHVTTGTQKNHANDFLKRSARTHGLDWARAGCMDIANRLGGNFQTVFEKDCGAEHDFGSAELSACEKSNMLLVKHAEIPGIIYDNNRVRITPMKTIEERFNLGRTFYCRKWRHEMSEAYKACLMVSNNTSSNNYRDESCFKNLKE